MSRFEEMAIKDGCGTEQLACVDPNGGLAVNIQDQTSPPLLVYANAVHDTTTLAAATAIDDYDVIVVSNVGLLVGDYIGIFNVADARFYAGTILVIAGTTISLDTPLDFAYQIGDNFQAGTKELNVDGSVTPVIFSLRTDPGINITADITRIILHMTYPSSGDDANFGDLAALTKGVVLRRVDGITQNMFNVKTNGEIGELAYDKSYDTKAPAGSYGLTARLTFAGQSKLGVAIRLAPDEDMQIIIQDNLTGLTSFRIMIEGHIVVGN
jgi:hypothetical protein